MPTAPGQGGSALPNVVQIDYQSKQNRCTGHCNKKCHNCCCTISLIGEVSDLAIVTSSGKMVNRTFQKMRALTNLYSHQGYCRNVSFQDVSSRGQPVSARSAAINSPRHGRSQACGIVPRSTGARQTCRLAPRAGRSEEDPAGGSRRG